MPKTAPTYAKKDAQAIWDLSAAMTAKVAEFLQGEGWSTDDQFDADTWEMWGERPTPGTDDGWEEFRVTVHADGKTASFSGDVPVPVTVLARAMMAVVGPYLDANAEH